MESRKGFYLGTMDFEWNAAYEEVNRGFLNRLRNDSRTEAPVYKPSTETSTEYAPFLMKNGEYESPLERKKSIDRIHENLAPQPVSINLESGDAVKHRDYEIRNARSNSGYSLDLKEAA